MFLFDFCHQLQSPAWYKLSVTTCSNNSCFTAALLLQLKKYLGNSSMRPMLYLSLSCLGRLSASTSSPPPPPPAPELNIYSRSGDSVVLVCRAPEGHRVVLFRLYRYRDLVPMVTSWGHLFVFCPVSYPVIVFILCNSLHLLRWTLRSWSLVLGSSSSLWGWTQRSQSSVNSTAVSTRTRRIVTVPSVPIWSWSTKKVSVLHAFQKSKIKMKTSYKPL